MQVTLSLSKQEILDHLMLWSIIIIIIIMFINGILLLFKDMSTSMTEWRQ